MQTQICSLWCHNRKTLLYKIGGIRFSCQFSVFKIVKPAKSSLNSAAALAIIRKTRYCKGNNLIVFDLNSRFYLLSISKERVSMKFGHFSDTAREYVITRRARRCRGSTIWAARHSSALFLTRPVGTAFTRMPSCGVSLATATITYLRTLTAGITILRTAIPSGIPAGSPPRPSWTAMSAATASGTASLPAKRTV